ncbi:MAG: copper resistance protein CopC [Burkholderiales bacterium]
MRLFVVSLVFFLGVSADAMAHAALVKSQPAQRALLTRAPVKIQLWFNERLEARYSTFSLLDSGGKLMDIGAVEVAGDDPKSLAATIKSLSPGRYTVKYRVLSTDGHVVENQFYFTVKQ